MEIFIVYFWILAFLWFSFGDSIKPTLKKTYHHWSFLWEDPLSEEELHEMIKDISKCAVETPPEHPNCSCMTFIEPPDPDTVTLKWHDGEITNISIDDFLKEE